MNTQRPVIRSAPQRKKWYFGLAAMLLSSSASLVHATDLSYSNYPLFYANGVQPNVALIIDNSSSMTATDTGGSGSVTSTCDFVTSISQPMTRIKAAKQAACSVISANASNMNIGLWDFSNSSPGGGNLLVNFGAQTQSQMLKTVNCIAISGSCSGTGVGTESSWSYGTPLADAVDDAVTAFFGSTSPIQYRCQKNFIVLFTDGSADTGIDVNSNFTLPSLNGITQQSSTWPGATTVKTGQSSVGTPNWDGFTDPNISWVYPPTGGHYNYYTWMDDIAQMAYDVDIKTTSSPAITGCPTSSPGSSTGKDCAGMNWDATDDTGSNATNYKQQNVTTYTVGFGAEANNESMRDTPLTNKITITPGEVNTSTDAINIAGHGLTEGQYVLYYKMTASNKKMTAYDANSPTTEQLTVTASVPTPADTSGLYTGMPLTYSNGGGTTLQYDMVSTSSTPTCSTGSGDIGGLTYNSTYFINSVTGTTFKLMSSSGTTINLTSTGTAGVQEVFTPVSNDTTVAYTNKLVRSGTSTNPINTTTNTITATNSFYNGEQVTYQCSSSNTSVNTSGISTTTCMNATTSAVTYFIKNVSSTTFQLATTINGTTVTLAKPTSTSTFTTYATFTPVANGGSAVTVTAASGNTPVNTSTETITGSNAFSNNEAVTYSCANGATVYTHTNSSLATYYAVYVDSTHFKLADSAANAQLCASGTASACLGMSNSGNGITVAGNANQTFTFDTNGSIGGMWAYETDTPPAASASLPDPSSDTGARGKYYVHVVDANNFQLQQCGLSSTSSSGYPQYCTSGSGTAVDFTSPGSGYLSTGPGQSYFATDASTLASDLQAAFTSINTQSLSQASLATNVATLQTGSYIYAASFNTSNWSGDVAAYPLDATTGAISSTPSWTASANMPGPNSRNLYTWGSSAGITLPTTSTSGLTANEIASLGNGAPKNITAANQLNTLKWWRGDDTTTLPGARTRGSDIIGDIMNGSPVYVGPPSGSYDTTLPSGTPGQGSYATFRDTTYKNRASMLYAGANDGFLHGFNGSTGVEVFGYAPGGVYLDWTDTNTTSANNGIQDSGEANIQKVYNLTQTNYGHVNSKPHEYFVDGKATVGDAYFTTAKAGLAANSWHTVLVSGLGRGGRSVYALDITDPATSFGTGNVLWEFNGSGDSAPPSSCSSSTTACMGYTFSRPQIARVCVSGTTSPYACTSYQWVAIFGNGYDAASDSGHLYIVNIEDGTLIKRIDTTCTTTTTGCGLSSVTVFTPASGTYQGVATGVYAGDLSGNVWKFDLSNPSSWTASTLYVAKDVSNNLQPITAAPNVVDATLAPYSLSTGEIVIVGTGTYFQTSDASYSGTPVNDSIYSIWDKNDGATVSQNQLKQAILSLDSATGYRTSTQSSPSCDTSNPWYSTNPACLNTAGARGWYINLVVGTAYQGERIAYSPLKVNYVVFFDTVIPQNTDPCTGGGTSWLYGVDAKTGGHADIFTSLGDTVSGEKSTVGVLTDISYISTSSDGNTGMVIVQGSGNGSASTTISDNILEIQVDTCPGCSTTPTSIGTGRMTWRQLQ